MEANKHILFISSWYPNRQQPTHGVFNKHFAEAAALHHKVSVLHLCSEQDLKEEYEFAETKENNFYSLLVYYRKVKSQFPLISAYLKRKRYLKYLDLAFSKLVAEQGQPNLMHLNVVLPAGIGVLHLHKKFGIPYVVNEGWTGYLKEDGRYKGPLMKWITRKVLAGSSFVLPVSEDLKKAMVNHGLNGNYRIVPNIIKTDVFLPGVKKANDVFKLIHISTLDPVQKNVEGIIRAFQRALEQRSKMELLVAGEGENLQALKTLVKQFQLERQVFFAGLLTEKELVPLIQNSDALIMFSNFESFGVVIGEALSSGIPVITSTCGGLTEHIGPHLGFRVECRNETQLSQAILHMANNKNLFQPVALREFVLQRYSTEIIAAQLEGIYTEVLGTGKT